jgi:hypothetical protein
VFALPDDLKTSLLQGSNSIEVVDPWDFWHGLDCHPYLANILTFHEFVDCREIFSNGILNILERFFLGGPL